MASIKQIYAREILNASGIPTVECSLWLDTGQVVTSSAPSGTSKDKYEAMELIDNDPNRMAGKGALKAVNNVNTIIAPQLIGLDPTQQERIDQLMINLDGTQNKSKLGSNAILAVSQAALKAGAAASNMPLYAYVQHLYTLTDSYQLPSPVFSVINGGEHGAGNLDIQEFQIIPASNVNFESSLNIAVTFFHKLEEVLISKGAIHSVGTDGGFAPNLYNNADAFEIMVETMKLTPFSFAQDVFMGLDVAASSFYNNGKYALKDKTQPYSSAELLEYYQRIKQLYHLMSIEDPFHEDDKDAWAKITAVLGDSTSIVGDSLLVTNKQRLQEALDKKLCNGILVKPNQAGTMTETIGVIQLAKSAKIQVTISHRSGDTTDDLVADLAVGVGADYVKFGPPNRGERTSKYNRLLQISQDLGQAQPT